MGNPQGQTTVYCFFRSLDQDERRAPPCMFYSRLNQLGLSEQFPGAANPFPWMSEMMDLRKEKNFFETRVIEYQTGGALSWD